MIHSPIVIIVGLIMLVGVIMWAAVSLWVMTWGEEPYKMDPYAGQKWEKFEKKPSLLTAEPSTAEGDIIGGEGGVVKKRGNKAGTAYVEVFRSKDQYYWRLRGGNWEILCHSEGYNRKQGAEKTALRLFNDLLFSSLRKWEFRDLT